MLITPLFSTWSLEKYLIKKLYRNQASHDYDEKFTNDDDKVLFEEARNAVLTRKKIEPDKQMNILAWIENSCRWLTNKFKRTEEDWLFTKAQFKLA